MKRTTMVLVLLGGCLWVASERSASAAPYENQGWLNQGWLNQGWLNQGWLNQGWLNQGWLNGGDAGGATPLARMTTWQGQWIDNVSIWGNTLFGSAWIYEPFWDWHWAATGWWWGFGWDWHYRSLAPTEFNGAHFQMTVSRPEDSGFAGVADARIASVTPFGIEPWSYLYKYEVYVGTQTGTMTTWEWRPGCGSDLHGPVPAIALQGGWNYGRGTIFGGSKIDNSWDRVTFACMNGALGKCGAEKGDWHVPAAMGYMPWRWRTEFDGQGGVQWGWGDSDHQTCTRLVTADYCGDGQPHTYAGRPIEQWDRLPQPVNTQQFNENATQLEAEWTPDGATWVECVRISYMPLNPNGTTENERNSCPTYTAMNCDFYGMCWPITVHHEALAICWDMGIAPNGDPNHMLNRNDPVVWNPAMAGILAPVN